MEAINYLTGWTNWLFILIPIGAGTMITYQAVRKSMAFDASVAGECNGKIVNTLKGAILGMTIAGAITIMKSFYGF